VTWPFIGTDGVLKYVPSLPEKLSETEFAAVAGIDLEETIREKLVGDRLGAGPFDPEFGRCLERTPANRTLYPWPFSLGRDGTGRS